MSNIFVDDVELKFSSEMGFNDMPKRVDVKIDLKMARPFGKQELERIFNNQYGRIYTKKDTTPQPLDPNGSESGDPKDKEKDESTHKAIVIPDPTINPPPEGTKVAGVGKSARSIYDPYAPQ